MTDRMSVDDLGTGHSPPVELVRLPVDMAKIGGSSVDDLSGGSADSKITGVILQLGAVLASETVAEGVEEYGGSTTCTTSRAAVARALVSHARCLPERSPRWGGRPVFWVARQGDVLTGFERKCVYPLPPLQPMDKIRPHESCR